MDPVDEFARNLVDDLRIAEEVRERDSKDAGERMTLEELIEAQGFDPEEFESDRD